MILLFSILTTILLVFPSPVKAATQKCLPGDTPYTEGGNCQDSSPFPGHSEEDEYALTCAPTILRYTKTAISSAEIPSQDTVRLILDLSQLELGGYGPDSETYKTNTIDNIARIYPFNSLFDKPNFSKKEGSTGSLPREASRTYWRLLSSYQQANAKAIHLTQAKRNQINNYTLTYYGLLGLEKTIPIKNLANNLPSCLTSSPVCSEYQEKYLKLPSSTKTAYDALLPFNLDNIKAFIALEDSITTENIPYINAINQGLLDPQTGLLNTLSPSWALEALDRQTTVPNTLGVNLSTFTSIAKNITCSFVPKSKLTDLDSPQTYPKPKGLSTTVIIPDITITRDGDQFVGKGEGEGYPLAVFNNPLINNITAGIISGDVSLFHMLLPQFALAPQKRTIDAPGTTIQAYSGTGGQIDVQTSTNHAGNFPVYRETGLIKDSLCDLKNKWLIPSGLQRYQACDSIAPPPKSIFSSEVNCDPYPDISIPGLISKQNFMVLAANWLYQGHPARGQDHAEQCYNHVVTVARQKGINPGAALAIWIYESNASNRALSPQDFGINDPAFENNFKAQLNQFLLNASDQGYRKGYAVCFEYGAQQGYTDMEIYLHIHRSGVTNLEDLDYCLPTSVSTNYYQRMKDFVFPIVAPGLPFSTYP